LQIKFIRADLNFFVRGLVCHAGLLLNLYDLPICRASVRFSLF
jgi:hypothetical protein